MKTTFALVLICLALVLYWMVKPAVTEPPNPRETPAFDTADSATGPASRPPGVRGPRGVAGALENEETEITSAIERLRQALNGESDEEIEEATLLLAELIQQDRRNLSAAWRSFETEADPNVLASLSRILAPHVLADAELFQAALGLVQNGDLPEKRSAALSMFSAVEDPGRELLDVVLGASREDGSTQVRLTAIQVLGQWSNNPARSDELSRELVKTIDASDEREVRGYAIQVIALNPEATHPELLGAMAEYMKEDPSAHNRAIAALALGRVTGELRLPALNHLEQAFARETNQNTRRNIMTQIARAGGQDAIAILQRLPIDHPLLAQDVRDYTEILRGGETAPDEVYSQKFARDAERGTIVGAYEHRD